jgi:aminoglycoside phosphotransferase (APT) family kinase protein
LLAEQLLPDVREYVNKGEFLAAMALKKVATVGFLAQGEYNLNYLLQSGEQRFVLRINTGSQLELADQIAYEFKALRLLDGSQVTPRAFYLDDSRRSIPYGLLVMEYLPGVPLDYRRHLAGAARALARIHGLEFPAQEVEFLVKEPGPFTGIYNEATRLLKQYFSCQQADPRVVKLLDEMLRQADKSKAGERYLLDEPWLRVINTELNSHNFIVNPQTETCSVIDWEKPIYGEPAQDLSHFLIATTTLWKQDYVLSREDEHLFIDSYLEALPACPRAATLRDRVEMFKFFNYLRAVSWCAMAWTEYTRPGRLLNNRDTFEKIKRYLEPEFLERVMQHP